jgi:hypothetical protein
MAIERLAPDLQKMVCEHLLHFPKNSSAAANDAKYSCQHFFGRFFWPSVHSNGCFLRCTGDRSGRLGAPLFARSTNPFGEQNPFLVFFPEKKTFEIAPFFILKHLFHSSTQNPDVVTIVNRILAFILWSFFILKHLFHSNTNLQ